MVCDERSEEASLWIVGVFLSIVASTCTNLGVNLQKYSFICEARRTLRDKRSYGAQPKWISGLLLVVIGGIGDFLALGFAPQTLITPVGGFTMVANVFFAHYFLNESFNRRDAIATALIIGGVIQVAVFADKTAECFTLGELVSFYRRPAFIVYVVITVIVCVFLLYSVRYIEKIHHAFGPNSDMYAKFKYTHPILYPALSGLFGAQSVLFAKSTAELMKKTFDGDNQFTKYGTYFIAFAMLFCIFSQIHWLAKGLESFDAVFIVPVFQCFFITISIVGGGVYFGEFKRMSGLQIAMFTLGVLLTLAGVYLLSHRKMNQLKPKQKFRARVHMIIFIKRLQRDSGMRSEWESSQTLLPNETSSEELEKFLPMSDTNELLAIGGDEIVVEEIESGEVELSTSTSFTDFDHQKQYDLTSKIHYDNIPVVDVELEEVFSDNSRPEVQKNDPSNMTLDEKSTLIHSHV